MAKKQTKQVAPKPSEWRKVVKRSTYPAQITRVITHVSAEQYFKDTTLTTHSKLSCEDLDIFFGGRNRDQFQDFGWAVIKEAGSPEALLKGVQEGSLKSLNGAIEGLKAFSVVMTQDPEHGAFTALTFTVAACEGTYETTITLVKK